MSDYIGLNPHTGRAVSDGEHIRQCIDRILTTPLGSRVERRRVGSLLPELIDQPLNGKIRMQAMAASVMALAEQEPRIELTRVMLEVGAGEQAGALAISVHGRRRGNGQPLEHIVALRG
ncbi:GPW/gp25 family protein [Chromobacterium violaceum]|uniref:GPW/gp25 family protein n=1 Tax=Chromobacterium violaceum TaxID=536 RepID=UPI00143D3C03|nr:GPW/gp25 family protein [Chromobacterium violaceum]QIY78342.1 baseplate assembly protein [Chromobacterium violaceum]